MKRSIIVTLFVLTLGACSSAEDRARAALEAGLSLKDELELNDVAEYPGEVICGSFTATLSYHEGRRKNAPFILRDDELNRTPNTRDWKIYCASDPAAVLLTQTGIGPFAEQSQALLKITQDFGILADALAAYYKDTSEFPTTSQGLKSLIAPPDDLRRRKYYRKDGYLDEVPQDPWGRPYVYEHERWAGTRGRYSIVTLGKSGTPGGEGADADVSFDDLPYLQHVAKALDIN